MACEGGFGHDHARRSRQQPPTPAEATIPTLADLCGVPTVSKPQKTKFGRGESGPVWVKPASPDVCTSEGPRALSGALDSIAARRSRTAPYARRRASQPESSARPKSRAAGHFQLDNTTHLQQKPTRNDRAPLVCLPAAYAGDCGSTGRRSRYGLPSRGRADARHLRRRLPLKDRPGHLSTAYLSARRRPTDRDTNTAREPSTTADRRHSFTANHAREIYL